MPDSICSGRIEWLDGLYLGVNRNSMVCAYERLTDPAGFGILKLEDGMFYRHTRIPDPRVPRDVEGRIKLFDPTASNDEAARNRGIQQVRYEDLQLIRHDGVVTLVIKNPWWYLMEFRPDGLKLHTGVCDRRFRVNSRMMLIEGTW